MFDRLGDESDLGDLSDLSDLKIKLANSEVRILKKTITVMLITTKLGELK